MVFHLEFFLLKSAINILSPALQILQEQDRTEKVNAARQVVSTIITKTGTLMVKHLQEPGGNERLHACPDDDTKAQERRSSICPRKGDREEKTAISGV